MAYSSFTCSWSWSSRSALYSHPGREDHRVCVRQHLKNIPATPEASESHLCGFSIRHAPAAEDRTHRVYRSPELLPPERLRSPASRLNHSVLLLRTVSVGTSSLHQAWLAIQYARQPLEL